MGFLLGDFSPHRDPTGRLGASGELPRRLKLSLRLRLPLVRRRMRRRGRLRALRALGREAARLPRPRAGAGPAPKVAMVQHMVPLAPVAGAYSSVLGQALRLRGCEVRMYGCGGGLPICGVGWSRRTYPHPCDRCAFYGRELAAAGDFPLSELAEALPWGRDGRQAPLAPVARNGSAIDPERTARPNVVSRLRSTDIGPGAGASLADDFLVSVAAVETAATALLERDRPDVLLMANGRLAAENTIMQVARSLGTHVVSYEFGQRPDAAFFHHGKPAVMFDSGEVWGEVGDRRLNAEEDAALDEYLGRREDGEGTYGTCFTDPVTGRREVLERLGLPPGLRLIGLFPNVTWDTATVDRDVGFASMLEWIERVLEIVEADDSVGLAVRSHPHEARLSSVDRIHDIVVRRIGDHPRIRVIPPDEPIDSYSLIDASELILTYTSTVGLEAAIRGRPVAMAGEAHYRGKGFTHDVESAAQLEAAIREGVAAPPDAVERARAYAYLFFFRAMIPIPAIEHEMGEEVLRVPGAAELAPGGDPYIDFVCEKVLSREPFVLPSDLALAGHRA